MNSFIFQEYPWKNLSGLRPEMYSLIYDENSTQKDKRTDKGIVKCAIDKQIRHLHYNRCLFENKLTLNDMD